MEQDEVRSYIDVVRDGAVTQLEIVCTSFVRPEALAENVRTNIKRDVPRFHKVSGLQVSKHDPLAIVAGGCSVQRTIDTVRGFEKKLACGSAHDWMVEQGITPTYALITDGVSNMKNCITKPQKETTFLLASQCEPALYDRLSGHKIEMWHFRGQVTADPDEEKEIFQGEPVFNWGCTVTLNSIAMALMMGYQHLHFFGFDSCYPDFKNTHAYNAHSAFIPDKHFVRVGPRGFITDMGMMAQAEQFFRLVQVHGQYFHSTIHGDGLIAEMVNQGDPALLNYISLSNA